MPAPARAHRRGVIDTNIVVLLRHLDPRTLPEESAISTVSLAELSVGPLVASTDGERSLRQRHLQQAEADFEPLPFDAEAARAYAIVAACLRRAGRKPSARRFDAMIAATALSHGLPLYTSNPDDVRNIDGLEVVAVPVPGP